MPAVDPSALQALAGGAQGVQAEGPAVEGMPQSAPQHTTDPQSILAQLYAKLEESKKTPPPGGDMVVHAQQVQEIQKEIDQVMKLSQAQGKAKAAFYKAGGMDLNSDPATDFIRRTVGG